MSQLSDIAATGLQSARWSAYVQEEAFFLHALRLSDNAASRISELAALAPQFFVEVLPDSLDPATIPNSHQLRLEVAGGGDRVGAAILRT